MTIKNGYKAQENRGGEEESGWYTFFETKTDASAWLVAKGFEEHGTFKPCRYIQADKYSFPFEVNEENLIESIGKCFKFAFVSVKDVDELSYYPTQCENYGKWHDIVEAGKNYMVGSTRETKGFLKSHSSGLSDWQRLAMEYLEKNPKKYLTIETRGRRPFSWRVIPYPEFVDFALPYHGQGGEKNYVVKWTRQTRKILVNVD